jgi:hypothetical protein
VKVRDGDVDVDVDVVSSHAVKPDRRSSAVICMATESGGAISCSASSIARIASVHCARAFRGSLPEGPRQPTPRCRASLSNSIEVNGDSYAV